MAASGAGWLKWAVPWVLSLSRLGLAAAFPFFGPWWRLATVIAAAASDGIDGYLARRWGVASWWGGVVDAGTDKFFTLTVLVVLTAEDALDLWQLALLLPRDAAVLGLLLCFGVKRDWPAAREMNHRLLGKAATASQFALLVTLILAPGLDALVWPLFALAATVTALAAADYVIKLGPLCLRPAPQRAGAA